MSQFPQVLAGTSITTALLDQIIPQTVIKPSDQSVINSTVLVNDTALVLPVNANATYIFVAYIDYEGHTQGSSDLQIQWTVPAGATLKAVDLFIGTGGANNQGHLNAAQTAVCGTNGAGVSRSLLVIGTLVTVGTAGNIQTQWAQNTADNVAATKVHAGSALMLFEAS